MMMMMMIISLGKKTTREKNKITVNGVQKKINIVPPVLSKRLAYCMGTVNESESERGGT
jgi:hypothetical protein